MLCQKFPRAKLQRQIFSVGEKPGEKLGEILGEILGAFSCFARCAELRKNFSQKSPQFITPCPANEMSKFHLCELLGLGGVLANVAANP